MAIITLDRVSLGYDTGLILKDISFTVEKGEYLSIVGENGSGKSTLMKALTGLLKPLSGKICWNGIREFGYLPQQTVVQRDFPASVWEVVLSGCIGSMGWRPFYTAKEKARALHSMDVLSISALKSRSYRELSGGQQQRVLLARALCAADHILLLDEPTAGLDPVVTAELYDLILHLNRDHGVTVIMVSHDLESALRYSTKILHLKETVCFFGSAEDYKQSNAMQLLRREENKDV